ncbi:hypothetical protein Gotur_035717 [Gossypium turneri]
MNILKESNTKKIDKKRITNEFLSQLRGEEDKHEEFIDEVSAIRKATRATEENHGERTSKSIPCESEFTLRGAIPELARSKSSKQPNISGSFLKTLRRKIGEAVPKFLIYERIPFQLSSSPWLYNLIQVSIEVGKGVKLPTPYEVLDVYLKLELQRVCDWVNGLKSHWKQLGATLMCDVDVSSVRSRDAEFYCSLLDSVVEEIGETHCLDSCLKDIGKKPNVEKVLDETKKGQQKSGIAYEAKKFVLGKDFWKKANDLIKVYDPPVKVLRLVDGDEKLTMSFIYEDVDRAKRAIQQDCQYFTDYEKIINNR